MPALYGLSLLSPATLYEAPIFSSFYLRPDPLRNSCRLHWSCAFSGQPQGARQIEQCYGVWLYLRVVAIRHVHLAIPMNFANTGGYCRVRRLVSWTACRCIGDVFLYSVTVNTIVKQPRASASLSAQLRSRLVPFGLSGRSAREFSTREIGKSPASAQTISISSVFFFSLFFSPCRWLFSTRCFSVGLIVT